MTAWRVRGAARGDVDLDDDLPVEVVAGVEVEVRVRGAGRSSWVAHATPFAMKSPVVVVMSIISTSLARSSTATTRMSACVFTAAPVNESFRVMAGRC